MSIDKITKVCAYFNNVYLDSFTQHCDEILNGGFNTILICAPESLVKWNLDNLSKMIDIAKHKGLDVWINSWGVGKLFDGETLSDTDRGCIYSSKTWNIVLNWIHDVTRLKPSTILWDNPKIKCDQPNCKCTQFKQEVLVNIFCRESKINNFGLKNYVYISAVESYDSNNVKIFDDIAELKHVDGIGSDNYQLGLLTNKDKYKVRYSKIVKEAALKNNKDSFIWVQGFGLKHNQEDIPIEAARLALEDGIKTICFWGFRACEGISSISPANSSLVWSKACNFFRSI